MTYFADLTPYTYCAAESIELPDGWLEYEPAYERVTIGWLDHPHPFPTGPTPPSFTDALLRLTAGPRVNVMRGFHRCTHCPPTTEMLAANGPDRPIWLGNAELRVPARPGVMFAAPNLIWHYVTAHHYLPPEAFIEAVGRHEPDWHIQPSPWIPDNAERQER
jgi:hypothetical protein